MDKIKEKKQIFLFILMGAVIILFLLPRLKPEEASTEALILGKYVMESTELLKESWVLLEEDTFIFNLNYLSSYLPVGTYSINDSTLTLHVGSHEYYKFTIDGSALIFEESNMNMPGDLVNHGSVFILSDPE